MPKKLNRRQFIYQAALGTTAAIAFPTISKAQNANSKLNVGFVAVGGRAGAHTGAAHGEGCQCIAFAEIDKGRWNGVLDKKGWGEAKGYTDWRQMFDICTFQQIRKIWGRNPNKSQHTYTNKVLIIKHL